MANLFISVLIVGLVSLSTIVRAESHTKIEKALESFHCNDSSQHVVDSNIVFHTNMTSVELFCHILQHEKILANATWFKAKEGKEKFEIVPVSKDHKNLKPVANNSLIITDAKIDDAGVYLAKLYFQGDPDKCYKCLVNLTAAPVVQEFDKGKNLIEGDKMELKCKVSGYPYAEVTWYKNNQSLSSEDQRVSILTDLDGIKTSTLKIHNVEFNDEGNYTCEAYSSIFEVTSRKSLLVSVKDKWAALWPFLGIVCEVVVLCTIIFIYEKRRNKQVMMDEKAAAEEVDGSASEKKEGLRHRGGSNPTA